MKKMNAKTKGFTIAELIGILVIIGVLLAIAVPTIGNVISNSYMKAYEIDLKSMEDGAKAYVLKKNIKLEPGIGYQIQVYEMVKEALIKPILDPKTKEECTGHVTVIDYNESYKFNSCLKCGTDYISDNCNKTDFIIPTITLLGDNPVNIFVGKIYSDAGATAFDDVNGDITDKIKVSGYINPDKPGVYTLSYDASDSEGNAALTVTRTINVIDNVDPIITFNPNGNSTYEKNTSVEVNVRDVNSGIKANSLKYLWSTSIITPNKEDFINAFTNGGNINTPAGVSGSYYLWITATDISNNKVTTISNVFNLDNEKPIITINGNSSVTINKGSSYTDAGASVTDNIDATVAVTPTGSVNPNIVGTYTITYNATDSSGNQATPVTRTINVIDVQAPVITITGSNPATVSGGGSYSDAGATAMDDVDGNVTSKITTTSNVNTNALGTYTVTYTVTDTSGNKATATRTVNVVDNILPTVKGASVPTTWTSGNKTITVTGTDTGLSGIAGYYISTSSTKPTTGSAWTASTSTTWTVSRGLGTYYIWIKDGAGNISTTYKSIAVTNIDGNAPTVTAKGTSYTITVGASNVISSTYFNISANGTAPISTTSCIDTSNGNATVTNTSTLAAGTHVIKCTVTKATGLSANAQTTLVVNIPYTCSTGTLTNDTTRGWICVTSGSSGSSCNSCTYTTTTTEANCDKCGKTCKWCRWDITVYGRNCDVCGYGVCVECSFVVYTSPPCPSGYTAEGTTCWKSVRERNCSKCGQECNACDYPWTDTGYNCEKCGFTCNSCTYETTTYGSSCSACGSSTYYYCPSGWSTYSGSGSSLKCYKAATQ